jgi:hypothetical protein
MLPAEGTDDAGPRLRESARPCQPPTARYAARRVHPSRKPVEQRADHGTAIVSGSELKDQPLVRRTEFGEGQAIPVLLAPDLGAIAGAMEDLRTAADRPREASTPLGDPGRGRMATPKAGCYHTARRPDAQDDTRPTAVPPDGPEGLRGRSGVGDVLGTASHGAAEPPTRWPRQVDPRGPKLRYEFRYDAPSQPISLHHTPSQATGVTTSRNAAASAGFLAVVVARLEGVEPPTHGLEVRRLPRELRLTDRRYFSQAKPRERRKPLLTSC